MDHPETTGDHGRRVTTETRSILFFDLAGWSKLTPAQVATYAEHGLPAVAALIERAGFKNSWGDAIVATFGSVRDAAECALNIRDLFRRGTAPGIVESLVPRISLHLGECIITRNPIIGGPDIFGDAVHLAARLEPVTSIGEVFCTERFANALAEVKGLGPTSTFFAKLELPKAFGTIAAYVVHGLNESPPTPVTGAAPDKASSSPLDRFSHLPIAHWLNESKADKGTNRLFEERVEDAFPGVRGVATFDRPGEAVDRLSILLGQPLQFRTDEGSAGWPPIWWWRGRTHNPIESFVVETPERCILGIQELRIRRVVVYRADFFWQNFVYVETAPDHPTGLYTHDPEFIERNVKNHGFAYEDYALIGGTPITREEFDDGSAVIGGKVIDIKGKGGPRRRYLSPYNFVVAAQFSPFNSDALAPELEDILSRLRCGETDIASLVDLVSKAPRYAEK